MRAGTGEGDLRLEPDDQCIASLACLGKRPLGKPSAVGLSPDKLNPTTLQRGPTQFCVRKEGVAGGGREIVYQRIEGRIGNEVGRGIGNVIEATLGEVLLPIVWKS